MILNIFLRIAALFPETDSLFILLYF